MKDFNVVRVPEIAFGVGKINELGKRVAGFGKTVMLISGDYHLRKSGVWDRIVKLLRKEDMYIISVSFRGEPSPDFIDSVVMEHRNRTVDVVLAIGGGSVLDAGKAVSAMLLQDRRVKVYLEGVGTGEVHDGRKVPFIAVPTTSGSGSEATSNAVLSAVNEDGFKKSLRHNSFVPDISIIDPKLMLSCPPELTASTGLDAIVQLVESYVSTKANPITDALAWSGLVQAAKNFLPACGEASADVDVRAGMAYASLMSGIALNNAGLGVVHGFAASVGAYFRIPHGVICAVLFAPSMKLTIENLGTENPGHPVLTKFSEIGYLLTGGEGGDIDEGCNLFIDTIYKWTDELKIPKLGSFGVEEMHLDMLVAETGQKNNPVLLTPSQLRQILVEGL